MLYWILAIAALAIIVGCLLPIKKANQKDLPRCPRPQNTDLKYNKTIKHMKDIPYCDEVKRSTDPDEEWLYD